VRTGSSVSSQAVLGVECNVVGFVLGWWPAAELVDDDGAPDCTFSAPYNDSGARRPLLSGSVITGQYLGDRGVPQ
jgi:hypothetical protein